MKTNAGGYRLSMHNDRTGNGFARTFETFTAAVLEIRRASRRLGMEIVSFTRPDGSDVRGPARRINGDKVTA